ncbi:hypothetical protein [Krasilnikovia sp. MM14-A1004]|uniref:hypothetical protein n=1 Tax=Krasilnikovia sp. MM14-A1004 TaxID=3373541 RepID=UPI00399CC81F
MQQVEGGQAHGLDPTAGRWLLLIVGGPGPTEVDVFVKALCCAMTVFVLVGALGIAVRRRRGR